jgi:hypothetical protein
MSDYPDLLKIDFSTFVLSLSTSALYQMGMVEGPDGEKLGEPNKGLAQQTIDTVEEEKLLNSLLYELQMHFVKLGE